MVDRAAISRALGDRLDAMPRLWHLIQVARYRNSRVLRKFVTPEHDLVLEGFPRCGNSFAERAFVFANMRVQAWAIATHAHRIAQVSLAVRYRLPTAIFVRDPEASIASYAALTFPGTDVPRARIERFIADKTRYYADYYAFVARNKDDLVISDFTTTTTNYGRVISAINARFGTDFVPFSDDPADVAAIFATTRAHLSPNPDRDVVKRRMIDIYRAPANAAAHARAERTYAIVGRYAA